VCVCVCVCVCVLVHAVAAYTYSCNFCVRLCSFVCARSCVRERAHGGVGWKECGGRCRKDLPDILSLSLSLARALSLSHTHQETLLGVVQVPQQHCLLIQLTKEKGKTCSSMVC